MEKGHILARKKLDDPVCDEPHVPKADIQQFMPSIEDFTRFFSTKGECCPPEELDAYAHGILTDELVKAQVEAHLAECKECSDLVALIKELSFKFHPEKSEFPALWELVLEVSAPE